MRRRRRTVRRGQSMRIDTGIALVEAMCMRRDRAAPRRPRGARLNVDVNLARHPRRAYYARWR